MYVGEYMIIQCEKSDFIKQDDLIALTRDDKFIGYGKVIALLDNYVLVDVDRNASKSLLEISCEDINYDFKFVNEKHCL